MRCNTLLHNLSSSPSKQVNSQVTSTWKQGWTLMSLLWEFIISWLGRSVKWLDTAWRKTNILWTSKHVQRQLNTSININTLDLDALRQCISLKHSTTEITSMLKTLKRETGVILPEVYSGMNSATTSSLWIKTTQRLKMPTTASTLDLLKLTSWMLHTFQIISQKSSSTRSMIPLSNITALNVSDQTLKSIQHQCYHTKITSLNSIACLNWFNLSTSTEWWWALTLWVFLIWRSLMLLYLWESMKQRTSTMNCWMISRTHTLNLPTLVLTKPKCSL